MDARAVTEKTLNSTVVSAEEILSGHLEVEEQIWIMDLMFRIVVYILMP